MDKNSFLIYLDYEEQFNLLTDEQIGQLMRAIIKYEKSGEIPKLDGMLQMAFSFIKTQLDRDREKYNKKCEKNRENAKRGGRPKKEEKQTEPKKANGFEEKQTEPKKPDNDNEDEDDNDNDDDLLLEKQKENLQTKFIECINSYNTTAIKECISYLSDLPFEVIESVLVKTSGIDKPNWNYAKTILDDYVKRKINTIEKVQIDTGQRKTKQEKTNENIKNYDNYDQRQHDDLDNYYANK